YGEAVAELGPLTPSAQRYLAQAAPSEEQLTQELPRNGTTGEAEPPGPHVEESRAPPPRWSPEGPLGPATQPQPLRAQLLRSAAYLPVGDVTAAGAHYRDILGFTCEYTGGVPPEFALYSRGACSIMLRRVVDPSLVCPNEKQGGTWDVFVWVADLDALYAELTAA